MSVEPEQRQHWAKEDRRGAVLIVAVVAQTATIAAALGGGFYWAGDMARLVSTQGERITVLETDRTLRASQGERMAVFETKLEAVVDGQDRLEELLKEALGQDKDPKRR